MKEPIDVKGELLEEEHTEIENKLLDRFISDALNCAEIKEDEVPENLGKLALQNEKLNIEEQEGQTKRLRKKPDRYGYASGCPAPSIFNDLLLPTGLFNVKHYKLMKALGVVKSWSFVLI